jgi:hypothetical protein
MLHSSAPAVILSIATQAIHATPSSILHLGPFIILLPLPTLSKYLELYIRHEISTTVPLVGRTRDMEGKSLNPGSCKAHLVFA